MLQKITEEELEFCEALYDPVVFIESTFADFDNPAKFDEDNFGEIRMYQLPMLSYEYIIDEDSTKLSKDNFRAREGAGNVYCFGGRKYGKTMMVEKLDLPVSLALIDGDNVGFSSYDALHIEGILEEVIQIVENHPFFKLFEPRVKRSPYYIYFKSNGSRMIAINMNIQGENEGSQFFQKHFSKLYIEEASFETEDVYKKRLDAVSENGCVFRLAGMTDFTRHMPAGKIFYDENKFNWVVNYPQYVNPKWDEKEKAKAVREHGGEDSVSYRIFVKGEIVEDRVSAIDMERVKRNYVRSRPIKHIEFNKEDLPFYQNVLIVERPANAEYLYLAADIGESAPTEIIVVSEVNKKFKYLYNITCYNLIDKEQFKVFRYLGEKLNANFIGLDCTDGTGRSIFHSLEEVFPKENLVWVGFNEKLPVDVERDENENIVMKDGKPVYREEYVETWSIKRLKELLYEEGKFELPLDYKLDVQLNSVQAIQSGNRTTYRCIKPEDHLFSAFRVFFIAQWMNEFVNASPIKRKIFSKIGV